MKNLLTVTAVIETGTGLALIAFPSMLATILLGSSLDVPAAITIARIAGVAIFALGTVCGLNRNDSQDKAARGLVTALAIYNFGAAIVLIYAGLGLGLSCIGLWSVVIVHTLMCVWCVLELLKINTQ
jgi:hypothetical protein